MELVIAHFACICFANLIIVASVSVLIHHVVSNERRLNTNMTENTNNNLSIKATWQGIFYVTIFMICWGPWYIWQWMYITSEMKTMSTVDSPALLYLISITYPLQGVGSALGTCSDEVLFRIFTKMQSKMGLKFISDRSTWSLETETTQSCDLRLFYDPWILRFHPFSLPHGGNQIRTTSTAPNVLFPHRCNIILPTQYRVK